jgi:NAD(P)H-dependent FMN reductase
MNVLALSGSSRQASTNTALLQALATCAASEVTVEISTYISQLPIFSPDLENSKPQIVERFIAQVGAADAILRASPEYVHAIPGGLKNALDWLVSGEDIVQKPMFLAHGSHRGEDMLQSLRLVLQTISTRFYPDVFLRVSLLSKTPQEVRSKIQSGCAYEQTQRFWQDLIKAASL